MLLMLVIGVFLGCWLERNRGRFHCRMIPIDPETNPKAPTSLLGDLAPESSQPDARWGNYSPLPNAVDGTDCAIIIVPGEHVVSYPVHEYTK